MSNILYGYAEAIKNIIVTNITGFISTANGSNFGVGYAGWTAAWKYAREHSMNAWGAILFPGGSASATSTFGHPDWRWQFVVYIFTKWSSTEETDLSYTQYAYDLHHALMENRMSIAANGTFTITDMMPMDTPSLIEGVNYIPTILMCEIREDP